MVDDLSDLLANAGLCKVGLHSAFCDQDMKIDVDVIVRSLSSPQRVVEVRGDLHLSVIVAAQTFQSGLIVFVAAIGVAESHSTPAPGQLVYEFTGTSLQRNI